MRDKRTRAAQPFVCKKVKSPIGGLVLVGNDDGLAAILWADDDPVGAANGKNPIAIIAPCHRVIGADDALTGFAGGLKAKDSLLALERGGRQIRERRVAG